MAERISCHPYILGMNRHSSAAGPVVCAGSGASSTEEWSPTSKGFLSGCRDRLLQTFVHILYATSFCISKCFPLTSVNSLQFCVISVSIQVLPQSHWWVRVWQRRTVSSTLEFYIYLGDLPRASFMGSQRS